MKVFCFANQLHNNFKLFLQVYPELAKGTFVQYNNEQHRNCSLTAL